MRIATIFLIGTLVLSLLVGTITAAMCMEYANAVFIPDNGALLGVSYNPAETEQDIKDLQSFENWSGKKHSIVVVFQAFSPDEQTPFPRTQMNNLWQNGNTPLLTLEPWGSDDILDVINNGTLDSYFEEYAQDLKNWTRENWTINGKTGTKKQLFLRFAHEMNLHDEAYPWSNKSPASYINAWKRVHNIFEEQGLTSDDVQWVWCVNHVDVPWDGYKAEEYYPGDDYVDWVAIDGYNVGQSVPCADWDNWRNFDEIFGSMLANFSNHSNISNKPIAITEFASSSVVDTKPVKEFNVYTNKDSPTNHYIPSGWMGDWGDISFDDNDTTKPHLGIACGNSSLRINYSAKGSQGNGWAGIYWQDPKGNWGDKEGGYNLSGATNLSFWARGENGGEKSEFMIGGLGSLKPSVSIGVITLTKEWKQYTINLSGNLSRITGGFCWVTGKADNPHGCTIYLDDIRYESSTGIKNVCVEEGTSNNTKKGEWITETYKSIKKYPKIKMVCYFNIDKGGTKYLTGESDWAVFTTPRDNRNNIDDYSFDPNKRICEYSLAVKDSYYIYNFPLCAEPNAQYLRDLTYDTWNCIAHYVDNKTGLPYDNSEMKDYTGIDKIGLYIASVAVSKELGFASEGEAMNRVNKTLNTLLSEDFKTWNGSCTAYESPDISIPYAWYNMTTLEPLPPTDIDVCTIDLGNYYACLIIGRNAFPELNQSFSKLLNNINWSLLYNSDKNLFYGGYNTKTCTYSAWNCSDLASDSQTASFLGIATGSVPAKHWERLNRSFEERYGHRYYEPGWKGGLFMQFLPGIFIDQRQTLMGRSAEEFTRAQIAHASEMNKSVWGWSPSSSPCGDEYIGYGQLRDEIVTPHASALAVIYHPEEVIQNLKKMEEMCVRAPLKMGVLDDFNDRCPPNNRGGNEGVWNSEEALIVPYFDNKTPHCGCGCSLRLNYNITATGSAGGYWWFFKGCPEFEPADISDYNAFSLWMKGNEEEGCTTNFYLEFADENWNKAIKEVSGIDNNWAKISVDLNSLKSAYPKVNWEKMRQVAIVLNQSITAKTGTLYFDDLDFGDGSTEYRFGFRDSINLTGKEFSGKFLTLDQAMIFLSIANYLNGTAWRLFMEDGISKTGVSLIEDYRGRVIYFAEGEDWTEQYGGGLDLKPHASNCSCLGNAWGNDGDYAKYAINLSEGANGVLFKMRYSDKFDANNIANQIWVYLDGELRGELSTEDTGDWDIFKWSDKVDIGYISAGEHELKIVSGNGGEWNCVYLDCFKLFCEEKPTIKIFDTGPGTYPSIFGIHNGTIKPNQTITVQKLYTYPCPGTGGHTEYARIWNNTGLNATARWEGYKDDWPNISFDKTFTLVKGETYNYTIRTGSYPQIHHTLALPTANRWINCTEFIDANGKGYDDWIPAIRLWT